MVDMLLQERCKRAVNSLPQLNIIEGAYSHRNDDTSVSAAAEYQRSGKLQRDQIAVLRLILENPGMTAGEIAYSYVGFTQVQICRRRKELEVPNLPFHPLIRRALRTHTVFEKRGAWVYEITQAGKDYLNQTTKEFPTGLQGPHFCSPPVRPTFLGA